MAAPSDLGTIMGSPSRHASIPAYNAGPLDAARGDMIDVLRDSLAVA